MRVKPKEYERLQACIAQGVMWGWQHAHKHVENPEVDAICDHIVSDVMSEICEEFDFDDDDDA